MTDQPRLTDGRPLFVPTDIRTAPLDTAGPLDSGFQALGTITADAGYTDPTWLGTKPDAPWFLPGQRIRVPKHESISVEFTLEVVNEDLFWTMFGVPRVWLRRPRMKRRAARRINGYTRTGQRRR